MRTRTLTFTHTINRQRVRPRPWDFTYLMLLTHVAVFREFAALLPKRPLRVLDVGCGHKPWVSLVPEDALYVGVDYSRECSSADALGSGDALPFGDNSFDAVICSEVLEHTRYPEQVVRELRRVCRPDGLLYVTSPFAFCEHGVPYDFQRLTRYFYRDVFRADEILILRETNSTISTGLTCVNIAVEASALTAARGLKHLLYTAVNLTGLLVDSLLKLFRNVSSRYQLYPDTMPLGFALVVRVCKSDT